MALCEEKKPEGEMREALSGECFYARTEECRVGIYFRYLRFIHILKFSM